MERRPWLAGILITLSLMVCGVPQLSAQTVSGAYVGATVAGRPVPDDVFGSFAVGLQGGYRFPAGLFLSGEYMYAGRDYYYFDFDGDRSWKQAASWSDVPSGDASASEWLFFRERHILGVAAGLAVPVGQVGLFGAAGFSISIIDLSDAEDNYPEFADAARESSIGSGTAEVSPSLRAGITFPASSLVSAQLSYGVVFRQEIGDDVAAGAYLWRNGLISVAVVLNVGALPGGGL
ncbi:MAG: hypothetical protein EA383_16330 [Spirochaetaceae bacterium]|nr:MAG: hypothetical protein EA383_16330 [Spirochaetaceae bacterium]